MKHVVITGADRGVGFSLVENYVKNDYVVYAGQFMPEWTQLEELKKQYPDTLHIIPLNVGSDESVKKAVELVSAITDCVDVLINCAGIYPKDESRQSFIGTFQVNTLGALRTTEAFLPLMENGQKRICTVSSEAGSISLSTRTGEYAYCSSKAALNIAFQMLFHKLRPQGFTFRLYHPGWVRSYMHGYKATEGYLEPEETAIIAYQQFTEDALCEDVQILQDVDGNYWTY